jgi:hypothetical protein
LTVVLPDEVAQSLADRFGVLVATLARGQFAKMLDDIKGGADPRDAIAASQASFTGAFADELAAAFSELLQRSIGVDEVLAMPVGDVVLSSRLYMHNEQTAAEAAALVREHAAGLQQARELALRLYDGYNPSDGLQRPLEGRARGELPAALRALTQDFEARASLERLIESGQQQAARVKSTALRAAYTEALDGWQAGDGQAALKRRLDVAVREKNRFMADRIAQTELARAHQSQVGQELMSDDAIGVVQVMINPMHPKRDICDMHGRADLWGLGPGCYPKAKAPQPPFHPFCWCKLRGRPSLRAALAREVPDGEAAYLRDMPLWQAGQVMGSKERARAVLDGASMSDVLDAGKDPLYRLRRLGDPVPAHALVTGSPAQPHPDALPNYAVAIIPDAKLTSYVLDPSSERGAHKARLFSSIMGFTQENAADLKSAILQAIPNSPALFGVTNEHGQRFQVDVMVTGPKGSGVVRTGWIIRKPGGIPSLTTAVPIKEKKK